MFGWVTHRSFVAEEEEGGTDEPEVAPPRSPISGLQVAGVTIIVLAILNYLVSSEVGDSGQETEGDPVQLRELPGLKTSKLVTNAEVKRLKFNKGVRNLSEAFKDSFPDEHSWWRTAFSESNKPNKTWYWQDVIYWAEYELVKATDEGNATFAAFQEAKVPVPIPQHSRDDQLDEGRYVGYTRRQVCYLAAKALTGAHIGGYDNGLTRYLSKKGPGGCLPRQDAFGRALFALLATCAADPTLEGGKSGPMILVVKHRTGFQDLEQLKATAATIPLSEAGFRLCRYDDGSVYKQGFLPGVPTTPKERCSQPSNGPGHDYLSTQVWKQAVVAASGPHVGGNIYGHSCGTGGAMEEVLMVFMPEVAVLSFFLSEAERPQLRAPAWVLGARMVLEGLDGTAHWTNNMRINSQIHFTLDLVEWDLGGAQFQISNSRPFVAAKPAFKVTP